MFASSIKSVKQIERLPFVYLVLIYMTAGSDSTLDVLSISLERGLLQYLIVNGGTRSSLLSAAWGAVVGTSTGWSLGQQSVPGTEVTNTHTHTPTHTPTHTHTDTDAHTHTHTHTRTHRHTHTHTHTHNSDPVN